MSDELETAKQRLAKAMNDLQEVLQYSQNGEKTQVFFSILIYIPRSLSRYRLESLYPLHRWWM